MQRFAKKSRPNVKSLRFGQGSDSTINLTPQHDLLLCSRDAHFNHLPQLARCWVHGYR